MRLIALLLVVLMLPFGALAEDYVNPMTIDGQYPAMSGCPDDYGIGDPFVLRWNGMYYMYPSTCQDQVKVFTSRDLVHWTDAGYCTQGKDVYFAYAPEVVYWRGAFYMITSPQGNGHYILRSDSPLGPFELITENFGYSIDGAFFKQDDGRLMMLYPDNWYIKSILLDEETMLPTGTATDTGATLLHWTEGPGLIRRGEWYYLTFTGNHVCSTGYRVSYASRKGDPDGAFCQREDATLLINSVFGDSFQGLGHSSNVIGPDLDSMYTPYHSLVSLGGPARLYNLDRLFTNGGLLYTTGPSNSAMPVPDMPDVWGDAAGELNGFTEDAEGYFAQVAETAKFTQEWNFTLNGGEARAVIGQKDGQDVTVTVNQTTIALQVGGVEAASTALPEIGPENCLHTLRVENTPEILYLYVDDMRVVMQEGAGYTASRVGACKADAVQWSFMACTAEALGSSDNTALKLLPGGFSARHALNAEELSLLPCGDQDEMAALLGQAEYNVRVADKGSYCFDLTVRSADAGKSMSLSLDGQEIWSGTAPAFTGEGDFFTFTTEAVSLTAGDYTLTVTAGDVLCSRISAFTHNTLKEQTMDFADKSKRKKFLAYGPFSAPSKETVLRIKPCQLGYALFGKEGYTDFSLDVTFDIPREGEGVCGVLLRTTDVSWYEAQVDDSYFGYCLALSEEGVKLIRCTYGVKSETPLSPVAAWKTAETGEVHIEVRGSRVDVYLPGEAEPVFSYDDSDAFTHGMWGFFSNGLGLKIHQCTIAPLE